MDCGIFRPSERMFSLNFSTPLRYLSLTKQLKKSARLLAIYLLKWVHNDINQGSIYINWEILDPLGKGSYNHVELVDMINIDYLENRWARYLPINKTTCLLCSREHMHWLTCQIRVTGSSSTPPFLWDLEIILKLVKIPPITIYILDDHSKIYSLTCRKSPRGLYHPSYCAILLFW